MTATAKQFLAKAAAHIGYREGQDPNGNWNNDNMFGKWYGYNGVAWCGQFVSYVANEVGALGTLVPKYQSCFAGLKWFRDRELTGVWPPRPGDIFIQCTYNPGVWNDTGNGWATVHTGIVEKWIPDSSTNGDTGVIQTIEGNTNDSGSAQGNGVYRLRRTDSRTSDRYIYCRPKWAPEPVVVLPPITSGGESIPPPAPKPPAPIPGATYTGSRTIDVSRVRPGRRSEAARRFNGLLWAWLCKNSSAYARKNLKLWMAESSYLYGTQAQRATQEMYRILSARDKTQFSPVTLPTWPGGKAVKAIGGNPV